MSSDVLSELVKQVGGQGKLMLQDAATEEQIVAFESSAGISLSKGYREWLRLSDGGEVFPPAGVQFYGVAHKPLIDVGSDDRPNDSYIMIGALCTGDPILCEKEGERISIYNHDDGTIESDETYESFALFLRDIPNVLGIEE